MHVWVAHGQLVVHQDFQVLLCTAAFQLVGTMHMLVPRVVPLYVQDFAFSLNEVPPCPFLWLSEVPLKASTPLCSL